MAAKNEKHSQRDYTGRSLRDCDPAEFGGTIIEGSCFSQETPNTQVFPPGTKDVEFHSCNLDGVALPPGSVLVTGRGGACCHRQFRAYDMAHASGAKAGQPVKNEQGNALPADDWELDPEGAPARPLNHAAWTKNGRNIDPKAYRLTVPKTAAEVEGK